MTRTEAPKDFVGRGEVNLARTTPELPGAVLASNYASDATGPDVPCGRVTLPQMTRILEPRISLWPL